MKAICGLSPIALKRPGYKQDYDLPLQRFYRLYSFISRWSGCRVHVIVFNSEFYKLNVVLEDRCARSNYSGKVLNSKDSSSVVRFTIYLYFFWFFKRKKANVRTVRSAKTSSENCILAGSHNILKNPIPLFENFSIEDDRQSVAFYLF